jgi:hypothetical protein
MFMIIEIIDESLGWRTFIHQGYQIIWNQGQNNENINKNQCILKQRCAIDGFLVPKGNNLASSVP